MRGSSRTEESTMMVLLLRGVRTNFIRADRANVSVGVQQPDRRNGRVATTAEGSTDRAPPFIRSFSPLGAIRHVPYHDVKCHKAGSNRYAKDAWVSSIDREVSG